MNRYWIIPLAIYFSSLLPSEAQVDRSQCGGSNGESLEVKSAKNELAPWFLSVENKLSNTAAFVELSKSSLLQQNSSNLFYLKLTDSGEIDRFIVAQPCSPSLEKVFVTCVKEAAPFSTPPTNKFVDSRKITIKFERNNESIRVLTEPYSGRFVNGRIGEIGHLQ